MKSRIGSVLLSVAAVGSIGGVLVGPLRPGEASRSPAQQACDRFASPQGSDRAPGTIRRPLRTPVRLLERLSPGETGCLRRGRYVGRLIIRIKGTAAKPLTLRALPGEEARIVGRVVLTKRSAHLALKGLHLDGRNPRGLPSPTVNGRSILFARNDVTNRRTGICFNLGHPRYGVARDVTLRDNRIHHCGRLPANNQRHGIYVSLARDTRILRNWIYANADRGIQLYPDARRTLVRGNVIDSNGEGVIFGATARKASTDNLVAGNVISNSVVRENVESNYQRAGPPGFGNIVRANCIGGGAADFGSGGIASPALGYVAIGNVIAVPAFRDLLRDYRLTAPDACTEVFAGDPGAIPGPSGRLPKRP